jgi:hypothetical protein
LIRGFPGSGKTFLALALAEAGIDQFSVSLDFPDERHDEFRRHPFFKTDPLRTDGSLDLLRHGKERGKFLCLTGWFFITLLPSSSLYPANFAFMAERWLYFPSIACCLMFAYALGFLRKVKVAQYSLPLIIAATTITILYSLLTTHQTRTGKTP